MGKLKLPTLLLIVDNASTRLWFKKHLQNEFFLIDTTQKKKALEIAAATSLDLIIVDSELTDCNALELCAECHQLLKTLTPILLITGQLKQTFRKAAMAAGVTDFLTDQLDVDELRERIEAVRKSRSLRAKTEEASAIFSIHKKKE